MNIKRNILLASVIGLAVGWNSTSIAGCLPPQVAGIWEIAFSDGNACRLRLNNNGSVNVTYDSVCYDPTRGVADIESGTLKVKPNCFSEGNIVVEGTTIELPVQFSNDRTTAAGRYFLPADSSKGSVVLIRVP